MNTPETQPGGSLKPVGSEILCKLVGADMDDRTVTIELPPGLTPRGLTIGQAMFMVYPFPNAQAHARRDEPRT